MPEYAILQGAEIINVVLAGSRGAAEKVASRMVGDLTVASLDSLPDDVKRRYRYWDERP